MQETRISNKVLGKTEKKADTEKNVDFLSENVLWSVYKEKCGKTVFDGNMASSMMTFDDKEKARNGNKKFVSENGFTFERLEK